MKKNYTRLCTLALAACMSMASWAVDIVDGVYQLSTPQDMLDFADSVLVVENGKVDAVLLNDIDMSEYPEFTISSTDVSYKGTFDGQFHTITVAMETNDEYHSLFRKLGAGTIKNLYLAGTMHAIGKHCAPLVGQSAGAGVIENVVTTVDIETTTSGDGSHAGLIGSVTSSSTPTISNVVVGGSLKGTLSNQCGGVIGWADGKASLNNVLVIADFEINASSDGTWGNLTFVRNPGNATLKNCYYLHALDVVDAGAIQITEEQLASGEACFMLNGSTSENPVFFQNLTGEVDTMPVPDSSHATVYLNGRVHCNGVAYEDGVFSNTKADALQDEHDFQDGVCSYCQQPNPDYITVGEDGFYELGTPEALCWFAHMVNGGETALNARLTAPIDFGPVMFPTIGNKNKKYAGTFDGQHMPITNIIAPLFGQTDGATLTGIALESGDIAGRNKDICDHNGTIVCRGDNTTLTNSYSKVNIVIGDEGDCGGLAGKFNGTIKNCYYTGVCSSSGWSHAGIAGSNEGTLEISDCFVFADLQSTGGDAKGTIVGWEGGGTTITNCVSIECPGFNIGGGHKEGSESNCISMDREEFFSGAATWFLNGNAFVDATWFQNLDEEESLPSLNPEDGVVFKISDDKYTNSIDEFKAGIIEEGNTYVEELVAYKDDIAAFTTALETVKNATEMEEFLAAYDVLADARKTLDASAAAYAKLTKRGEEVAKFIEENADELFGPTAEALRAYVEDDVEPNEEQFPNGSLSYITENMLLTAEQAEAEVEFLNSLQEAAIKANYKKGDEITNLIVNADLSASPRWNGWETLKDGSTLTTGGEEGVMTTAEFWNAKGNVLQTLTGLKNGVYELRANAATRPASNTFNANDNYIAYLVANNDEVYVQALTEDMVDDNTAMDGVNCHLTGEAPDHQLEIDGITYYVPYGPVSAAYAFNGGRYVNRVLTNVTDGTLKVGIRLDGTGVANDWMGFGNFRLFYLGTTEEAADVMGDGMDNYVARANTLIDYIGTTEMPNPENTDAPSYKSMPNFSQALRDELQKTIGAAESATTAEEKLAACARFTEIFHEIDSCKAAYIEYMISAYMMIDAVYADTEATDAETAEISDAVDAVVDGFEQGTFTTEEAVEMALLKNTAFYKRYFDGAPAFKNGYYQLASAEDLVWFSNNVNNLGNVTLCGEIVAPINMTDVEYLPIGTATGAYAGSFKGNLYPITGLTTMFFGTVDGATIDGVNLQGGVITESKTEWATQTGSLAGFLNSGTVTRCYSNATITGGAGDIGGLFGKVNTPVVIRNCMFAGNFTAGWSAGSIAGSTDGNNEDVTIADILIDSRNITYKNGDGHGLLVGWFHDGNQNKLSNVWVIEGSELTDIVGYNNDKSAVASKTTVVTAADAASGMVAYGLNNGETTNPVWFQTIGTDEVPTFSSDSKVVLLVDGEYVNAGAGDDDEDAIQALKSESQIVNVYDLSGRMVLQGVDSKTGLRSLPNGLYIIGGRKVMK